MTGGNTEQPQEIVVHYSRVVRVEWMWNPDMQLSWQVGWPAPMLQRVFTQVMDLSAGYDAISRTMSQFWESHLGMDGLAAVLGSSDGITMLQQRLQSLDVTRSIGNSVAYDRTTEELKRITQNVAGMEELQTQLALAACSVYQIPYSRLFGHPPKGMNATGEMDQKLYVNTTATRQSQILNPPMRQILGYTGAILGVEEIPYRFKPLEDPNIVETAKAQRDASEAMQRAIDARIFAPSSFMNVAAHLFGIAPDDIKPGPPLPPEEVGGSALSSNDTGTSAGRGTRQSSGS